MTKGADSIMLPRLILDNKTKEKINADLYAFAIEGLRTLVMAQKEISDDYYEDWYDRFEKINISNDMDKEDKLGRLYDEME